MSAPLLRGAGGSTGRHVRSGTVARVVNDRLQSLFMVEAAEAVLETLY
jgi:hypothetical protein